MKISRPYEQGFIDKCAALEKVAARGQQVRKLIQSLLHHPTSKVIAPREAKTVQRTLVQFLDDVANRKVFARPGKNFGGKHPLTDEISGLKHIKRWADKDPKFDLDPYLR